MGSWRCLLVVVALSASCADVDTGNTASAACDAPFVMDRTVGIDRAVDVFTATPELEPRDQLTTGGESSQPDISPDGKQITYVNGNGSQRTSEFGSEEMSIYVMGIDGGGSRRVSGSGSDEYPDWSPDGARIVFERSFTDIVVLSIADGTEEVIGQGHRPSWSPAGDLIAFTDREGDGSSGLWVMRPDGTERRRLADSTGRQPYGRPTDHELLSPPPTTPTLPSRQWTWTRMPWWKFRVLGQGSRR
jgi:Tol biopolymer transport system component